MPPTTEKTPTKMPQLTHEHWIETFTGLQFDLSNPLPGQIHPLDIAVALARTARFNGHTKFFYSVAQHAFLASVLVPREHALAALLHDASEAYTGDIVRPLKRLLGEEFALIEHRIEQAVALRFDLPPIMSPYVKVADNRLLAAERRDLMPGNWQVTAEGETVEPASLRITPQPPRTALYHWLDRFEALTGERHEIPEHFSY
jgi:glycine/D-amino acid oxidase-like deaminating enzyme